MNRFSSHFIFKDVIPKELQSHIVYKFSCGNCNVTNYGKTERHLNVRSSEQLGISHSTEMPTIISPFRSPFTA